MKQFLIVFAWISIIGSFGDGLIALYCGYLVLFEPLVEINISVEHLIKNYIGFLYWVKEIAHSVLPKGVVSWLFLLPALLYFPVRVISSVVIGWWILRIAAKIPPTQ